MVDPRHSQSPGASDAPFPGQGAGSSGCYSAHCEFLTGALATPTPAPLCTSARDKKNCSADREPPEKTATTLQCFKVIFKTYG